MPPKWEIIEVNITSIQALIEAVFENENIQLALRFIFVVNKPVKITMRGQVFGGDWIYEPNIPLEMVNNKIYALISNYGTDVPQFTQFNTIFDIEDNGNNYDEIFDMEKTINLAKEFLFPQAKSEIPTHKQFIETLTTKSEPNTTELSINKR